MNSYIGRTCSSRGIGTRPSPCRSRERRKRRAHVPAQRASRNASVMPLGGDEVLVVPGVTDERPTGSVRLAEEVRHRGSGEARASRWRPRYVSFGATPEPSRTSSGSCLRRRACSLRVCDRPAADHQREIVVRLVLPPTRFPDVRTPRSGRRSGDHSSRCSDAIRLLVVLLGSDCLPRTRESRPSAPITTLACSVTV